MAGASFALIVYASGWIKCHYPDVFAAALLNSQPMGFYASAQLVRDAQEHGVMVREPAKWVAALRHSDPEWSSRCLFRCETGAGAHVGPSGRVAHLDYEAEVYAWVLDRLAVTQD